MSAESGGASPPPPSRKDVAASVRQRLLNLTPPGSSDEFQVVLTRYGLERLLYRLAQSAVQHEFVLKGAALFTLWQGTPHRRTRDVDLLGRGEHSIEHLVAVFRDLCVLPVVDDGLVFNAASVRAMTLNADDDYAGVRVTLTATLERARLPLQVDIGFGDVVTPAPRLVTVPTLLDFPAPALLAYPMETVVAEKFHAIVEHGMANTRLKDYYDLWILSTHRAFEGPTLAAAIGATFARRRTPVPSGPPLGLTATYADDPRVQALWTAFLKRAKITDDVPALPTVVAQRRAFLLAPAGALHAQVSFTGVWAPSAWSAPDQ